MAKDYSVKNLRKHVKGNQPGKMRKPDKIESSSYLPAYINTPVNKKFLQSTLDQMISKASFETLDNWVGKTKAGWFDPTKDKFLGTPICVTKRYYNGVPGFVIKDPENTSCNKISSR